MNFIRKDYPNGTVVKIVHNGYEGIIIDREEYSSGEFVFYIVELSYGETVRELYTRVAPINDPIHDRIVQFRKIGKDSGYRYMYIAQDTTNDEWTALYGNEYSYADAEKDNPHLKFYWIWETQISPQKS